MGQRLLLVDSDRSFLKEHQVSLEAAFDLEVAGSPDGVISRLENGAYAAVLICVEVADNKGYALCSTIRKNAKLDDVRIALISAKATEEEYRRHQSLKGRADLYLHKPIAPSSLVAALAPLVPGRALDPDNPLGELVDTELGDDWLDGLKGALDGPAPIPVPTPAPTPASAPVFGVRPSSPVQTTHLDAKATAPPDTSRMRLLEEQVAALREELHAKDRRLAAADQRLQTAEVEAQQVQRQLNVVTLNLDELERSNRESEALKVRLAETEAALCDLVPFRTKVEELASALAAKQQELEAVLAAKEEALAKQQALESALNGKEEALTAKQQELEATLVAQGQLNTTIEGLVEQHANLEGLHQTSLLDVEGYKEKNHTFQLEIAGLEATLRGQGRDLAELGMQLRQREAELEASQSQVLEREQQVLARQEVVQQHLDEIALLTAQLGGVRQELDEAKILHEGERLELMNGLDQKEGENIRLSQALTDQLEAQRALEREKQAVHGQLSEHRDRLQNLDGLLQEIQDKLRRGSDLAKG